jgi:hypothetical protein
MKKKIEIEFAADVQPKIYEIKVISQYRNKDVNRHF